LLTMAAGPDAAKSNRRPAVLTHFRGDCAPGRGGTLVRRKREPLGKLLTGDAFNTVWA
jgi:hypothetical protein